MIALPRPKSIPIAVYAVLSGLLVSWPEMGGGYAMGWGEQEDLLSASWADTTESNPIVMPTVEVSATRLDTPPEQQPYSFHRATREELDSTNARTVLDNLNFSPGVFVQHTAPNQASPFLRGLTGEQTLLLLDGVRFSHAAMRPGPNQYSSLIPDMSVDAIDVVLGNTSPATGSDALTGMLDLRLASAGRAASTPFGPWARMRTSSADGWSAAAGVDGAAARWMYSTEIGWESYRDRYGGRKVAQRLFGVGGSTRNIPSTAYDQLSLGVRLARAAGYTHRTELNIGFTKQLESPRPDGYFENSGDSTRVSREFNPQQLAYVHARHYWARQGLVNRILVTAWMHDFFERQIREGLRSEGDILRRRVFEDGIRALGLELQARAHHGDMARLTFGVTHIHEKTRNDYEENRTIADDGLGAPSPVDPDAWFTRTTIPDGSTYSTLGIFGQADISLTSHLRALIGARYSRARWKADLTGRGYTVDAVDDATGDFTITSRLALDTSDRSHGFVGIGQGFRAPNLTNLTGRQDRGSSGEFFAGEPDLRSERSLTVEAGWRLASPETDLGVGAFATLIDELIQVDYKDTDNDGEPDPVLTNSEEGRLWGGESWFDWPVMRLHGDLLWISLHGTASLVRGDADVPQPDGRIQTQYISRANRVFGTAGIRLEAAQWWCGPRIRWSADYDRVSPSDSRDVRLTVAGSSDGRVPGFVVADLVVGWSDDDGHLSIDLRAENLFDKTYRNAGSSVDGAGRGLAVAIRASF